MSARHLNFTEKRMVMRCEKNDENYLVSPCTWSHFEIENWKPKRTNFQKKNRERRSHWVNGKMNLFFGRTEKSVLSVAHSKSLWVRRIQVFKRLGHSLCVIGRIKMSAVCLVRKCCIGVKLAAVRCTSRSANYKGYECTALNVNSFVFEALAIRIMRFTRFIALSSLWQRFVCISNDFFEFRRSCMHSNIPIKYQSLVF